MSAPKFRWESSLTTHSRAQASNAKEPVQLGLSPLSSIPLRCQQFAMQLET